MEYVVVSATSQEELKTLVEKKLDEDYLLGGFSVDNGVLYQALYKEACGTRRARR